MFLLTITAIKFLNSLPNDKFLDWSKLKTFADNNKCNLKQEDHDGPISLTRVQSSTG